LLYALIILFCWFGEERKPKLILASLILFTGLCSFHTYREINNHERKQIVVYDVPKEKAIAFISGNKVLYDFDTELWNNSTEMAFSVWHHWANCRIAAEIPLEAQHQNTWQLSFGKLVLFEGKKILIINSAPESNYKNDSPLKLELVIISGNPKIHIPQLKKLFDFKQVVFDSSNKTNNVRLWKTECDGSAIQYWDTRFQGAYLETIN
jgi:competence protein ComEC